MAHPSLVRENTFGIDMHMFVEEINLDGAKCLEKEYMPGYPVIMENTYGKGKATYLATQYFRGYALKPRSHIRNRIADFLAKDGVYPYASMNEEDKKEPSTLLTSSMQDENGALKIVTLTNTDYVPVSDTLVIEDGDFVSVDENSDVCITHENGKCNVKFTLGALQSLALYRNE